MRLHLRSVLIAGLRILLEVPRTGLTQLDPVINRPGPKKLVRRAISSSSVPEDFM